MSRNRPKMVDTGLGCIRPLKTRMADQMPVAVSACSRNQISGSVQFRFEFLIFSLQFLNLENLLCLKFPQILDLFLHWSSIIDEMVGLLQFGLQILVGVVDFYEAAFKHSYSLF